MFPHCSNSATWADFFLVCHVFCVCVCVLHAGSSLCKHIFSTLEDDDTLSVDLSFPLLRLYKRVSYSYIGDMTHTRPRMLRTGLWIRFRFRGYLCAYRERSIFVNAQKVVHGKENYR